MLLDENRGGEEIKKVRAKLENFDSKGGGILAYSVSIKLLSQEIETRNISITMLANNIKRITLRVL